MPFPAFDMVEYITPEFTRYADAQKELKGPGDARATALQVVKDNDLEGTGYYNHDLINLY
jgi:hypothetical protein